MELKLNTVIILKSLQINTSDYMVSKSLLISTSDYNGTSNQYFNVVIMWYQNHFKSVLEIILNRNHFKSIVVIIIL